MSMTIFRSKQIGSWLGLAGSVDSSDGHRAHFQLYSNPLDDGSGMLLARDESFDADGDAIKMFNDWMHEAYLLVAAGDM